MADKIETLVENHLVDGEFKLKSAIDLDSLASWPSGSLRDCCCMKVHGYPDLDFGDFMSYENVGMASGAYLAAMSCKYKVTGEENSRLAARRVYQGIRSLYNRSQAVAPGFFSKCWGNQITGHTSSDQFLYVMTGLDYYFPIAASSEQKQIRAMLNDMAYFWKSRDYIYPYYNGIPMQWQLARFPGIMRLASRYSNQHEFAAEADRLQQLLLASDDLPFRCDLEKAIIMLRQAPAKNYESYLPPNHKIFFIDSSKALSGVLSLLPLMKEHDGDYERLLDMAIRAWRYGLAGIAPEGNGYALCMLNLDSGELKEVDEVYFPGSNPDWQFADFIGPYRHGGMQSAMFANASVMLAEYFPEMNTGSVAADILRKLKPHNLTWFDDPKKCMPPGMDWMSRVFSGDAACNWLWTYWGARLNRA